MSLCRFLHSFFQDLETALAQQTIQTAIGSGSKQTTTSVSVSFIIQACISVLDEITSSGVIPNIVSVKVPQLDTTPIVPYWASSSPQYSKAISVNASQLETTSIVPYWASSSPQYSSSHHYQVSQNQPAWWTIATTQQPYTNLQQDEYQREFGLSFEYDNIQII